MTTSKKISVLTVLMVSSLLSISATNPALASKSHRGVELSVVIEGSPQAVFEAIQQSRMKEPLRRKVVSQHEGVALIDEKFSGVPLLGNAQCIYKEVETPYKRIDFSMITSEKLKSFEGSWILTPLDNGERTEVKLNTFSEPKLCLPFASQVACSSISKDIRRRLANLKSWVETPGRPIASRTDFQATSEARSDKNDKVAD